MAYLEHHNANPKPLVWTASAAAILGKGSRAKQALESQHQEREEPEAGEEIDKVGHDKTLSCVEGYVRRPSNLDWEVPPERRAASRTAAACLLGWPSAWGP
jgi:hypothetical protein